MVKAGDWSPGQRLGFVTEEIGYGTSDGAVILDESTVEICKP